MEILISNKLKSALHAAHIKFKYSSRQWVTHPTLLYHIYDALLPVWSSRLTDERTIESSRRLFTPSLCVKA